MSLKWSSIDEERHMVGAGEKLNSRVKLNVGTGSVVTPFRAVRGVVQAVRGKYGLLR